MICEKCKNGGLLDMQDHFEWCDCELGEAMKKARPLILEEGNEVRLEMIRRMAA